MFDIQARYLAVVLERGFRLPPRYREFEPQVARIRMALGSNEAIKQAIIAGLGVSIMSRYTMGLDTEQRDVVMLDVDGLPVEGQWYFAYAVGKQPSLVVRSFMEFARVCSREMIFDHLATMAS